MNKLIFKVIQKCERQGRRRRKWWLELGLKLWLGLGLGARKTKVVVGVESGDLGVFTMVTHSCEHRLLDKERNVTYVNKVQCQCPQSLHLLSIGEYYF